MNKLYPDQECRDYGVIPQRFLSDDAKCFTKTEYTNHLTQFVQTSRYAELVSFMETELLRTQFNMSCPMFQRCSYTVPITGLIRLILNLWLMAID